MDRGKLCRIIKKSGKIYYNHQTWLNGQNVVKYVPEQKVEALKIAIEGYQSFIKLIESYADFIIKKTRKELLMDESKQMIVKTGKKPPKPGI